MGQEPITAPAWAKTLNTWRGGAIGNVVRGSLFFGRFDLVFFLFYIYLFYLLAGFNLFILLPLIRNEKTLGPG